MFFLWLALGAALLTACHDNDTFTTSSAYRLCFSTDTLSLDTLFTNIPSATRSMWAYNPTGKGLRCTSIRLERGNQTGFQVIVDGIILGKNTGYQTGDVDIYGKDSIRIYVKMLAASHTEATPKKIDDNLIFTLESGITQRVNLKAYAWDAVILNNVHITADSVLSTPKPTVIYGGITVDEGATLTLPAGTVLYFNHDAGIDVKGRLVCAGSSTSNVVLRGSRLDRLFPYLPYDRVSGQWKGIRLRGSSFGNDIRYTDIHSTFNGIEIDSSDVSREKLSLNASTIHNCLGYGIVAKPSKITLENTEISNTQKDCIAIEGGHTYINSCTLAQFYPFTARRGVALRVDAKRENVSAFQCLNTIITGYANDELSILFDEKQGNLSAFAFSDCLMRTPVITDTHGGSFQNIIYEEVNDTVSAGKKNFIKVDNRKILFDFGLSAVSKAIGNASAATAPATDRNGVPRTPLPAIGAYMYIQQ